jgi:hypothetical protein
MNTDGTAQGNLPNASKTYRALHRYARAIRDPRRPARSATSGGRKGLHQRECAEFPQRFDPGTDLFSIHRPPPAAAAECLRRLVTHAGGNQASWQVCSSSAPAMVAT